MLLSLLGLAEPLRGPHLVSTLGAAASLPGEPEAQPSAWMTPVPREEVQHRRDGQVESGRVVSKITADRLDSRRIAWLSRP